MFRLHFTSNAVCNYLRTAHGTPCFFHLDIFLAMEKRCLWYDLAVAKAFTPLSYSHNQPAGTLLVPNYSLIRHVVSYQILEMYSNLTYLASW